MAKVKDDVFDFSTSDFETILKTRAFVDKTLLIKDIFYETSRILVTAPRKFGKSTNIDMVKRFLEIVVNEAGIPVHGEGSQNYSLFVDNDLEICKHKEFFDKNFGKHPVMYINYKPLSEIDNYECILSIFRTVLHQTFLQHIYLLRSTNLWVTPASKDLFIKYCDDAGSLVLTIPEIQSGFFFLSRLLYERFRQKVFVLIDDYDAYANSFILKQNPDFDKIMSLMQSINANLLKCNKYVGRAFLTGVLSLTGVGFATLGDVIVYKFLDNHRFCKYYGLTSDEIDTILMNLVEDCEERKETKRTIEDYYSGYKIGNQNIEVHNMYSVLRYLNVQEIENHWYIPGYYESFMSLFKVSEISEIVRQLLLGYTLQVDMSQSLSATNILQINDIIKSGKGPCEYSLLDTFLILLYHFGYLSVNQVLGGGMVILNIPNEDIKYKIAIVLAKMYSNLHKINRKHIQNFHSSIDSYEPSNVCDEKFKYLCESINDMFSSPFCQETKKEDIETILILHLVTQRGCGRTLALKHCQSGSVAILVKNKHKVALCVTAKCDQGQSSRTRREECAKNALRKMIDERYYEHIYGHYDDLRGSIMIAIAFSYMSKEEYSCMVTKKIDASIAYSYYFKEDDSLQNFRVASAVTR